MAKAKAKSKDRNKLPATVEEKPSAKLTWDELQALVKRAEKGDRTSLPKLREALKGGECPAWSRWFLETLGNPARWLNGALAKLVDETNLAFVEASQEKLIELRKELEGPSPTPIERLLTERAVHCWFIMNYYETIYIQ